jgi:hypothetical protein
MLFPGSWQPISGKMSPVLRTPLGTFRLDLQIAGMPLHSDDVQVYSLLHGPQLFVSTTNLVSAALLLTPVHPELPKGKQVTASYAAVWRIQVERSLADYAFSCRWTPESRRRPGSPCSGQGLEAQIWSDGQTSLTLGTQNLWAMLAYRGSSRAVPPRWMEAAWSSRPEEVSFAKYLPDGFVVTPPELEAGEMGQIHFVIAWAPEPEGDTACWFAVDLSPSEVLSGIG